MLQPRRDRNTERESPTVFKKVVFYFTLIMTLVYIGAGAFLMFADTKKFNLNLPDNIKYLLGGALILYGIVRFVRAYQKNSQNRNDKFKD